MIPTTVSEREVAALYWQSLGDARSATAEQIDLAEEAQEIFNITYLVERHFSAVVPDLPETERRALAREIAPTCNGEGVAEACRRYVSDTARAASLTEFEEMRLDDKHGRNDSGNGERFAKEYVDTFKFLDDRHIWVRWDQRHWREASEGDTVRAARELVKNILDQATLADDEEMQSWAHASLSRRALINTVACASTEKLLVTSSKKFDCNPDLLTVRNGTVDLQSGKIYPHAREDMITSITSIPYELDADCPRWLEFLDEIFLGDHELIAFVQRCVGYSLTGHTREHAFFVLWGSGRNGKGTFIKQLMSLAGSSARTTAFDTFTSKRDAGTSNTPALASLFGARLVVAGEPDQGVRLSESVIKSLTGEDEIEVCQKFERPFRYIPLFKIWLHVNYKPAIRGTDEGIWARPKLIPFNASFMTEEEAAASKVAIVRRRDPDRKLDAKLRAERAGILAWAVRGARDWYRQGLGTCSIVKKETDGYRAESDHLGAFIQDMLKVEPNGFITNDRLNEAYSAWCKRNLIKYEMTGQTLSKQLVSRGFERGKNEKDVRGFKNVSLVQTSIVLGGK